ncbi:MAG: hypothetical protein JWQ74_3395 [Marmoricola sp.]|nr:hypothetical protein [Marmoricola sp.]
MAAGLVAVGLVLVALVGQGIPRPSVVMPAGPEHAPAIPRNIYQPSSHLSGVSDEGPPGQLAVVGLLASSDEIGPDRTWFGISATDGRYVKLDLPGVATSSTMALSPDGTRVAYWVTGPTRKKVFEKTSLADAGPLPPRPIGGIAVYDTRDGSVIKHLVPSDFGISGSLDLKLAWLSNGTLEFGYLLAMAINGGVPADAYSWDVGRNKPKRLPGEDLNDADYYSTSDADTFVRMGRGGKAVLTDAHGRGKHEPVSFAGNPGRSSGEISLSSDYAVLMSQGLNGSRGSLFVAARPATGLTRMKNTSLDDVILPRFLGWTSESQLLVSGFGGAESVTSDSLRRLFVVDLAAKTARAIGADKTDHPDETQVARDLVTSPMVAGLRPPTLRDAYRAEIIVAGLMLVALAGWFLVRSKRWARWTYRARERGSRA